MVQIPQQALCDEYTCIYTPKISSTLVLLDENILKRDIAKVMSVFLIGHNHMTETNRKYFRTNKIFR